MAQMAQMALNSNHGFNSMVRWTNKIIFDESKACDMQLIFIILENKLFKANFIMLPPTKIIMCSQRFDL